MNKLDLARGIVIDYDYPEDVLSNCTEELTEDDFIFEGSVCVPFLEITPNKLAKSLHYYIGMDTTVTDEEHIPLGSSKLYGLPHLPQSVEWPKGYYFYAQLNFAELKQFDMEGLLPDKGLLYLFFDASFKSYSYDCKAIYFDGPTVELAPREYPEVINKKTDKYHLDEFKKPLSVKFFPEFSFYVFSDSEIIVQLLNSLSERIKESTALGVRVGYDIIPKMFGRATYYQLEDYEEWDPEEDDDCGEIKSIASDNVLLFDNSYGDGNLHFWIGKEDLKKLNFDQIEVTYSGT